MELIDDVISEVMLVVWQQAGRTERRARASTWLLGIANFRSLHALRKAARGLGTGSIAEEPGDNGRALRVVEQDDLLHVALRHLSPEQRTVLELVYFNGLHYDDIAQVVGCPENTVKTRVFHARKRLRALWPSLTGDVASRPPR